MRIKFLVLIIGAVALLSRCQPAGSTDATQSKKGMVVVTILYPNGEGKTFDMDYYSN